METYTGLASILAVILSIDDGIVAENMRICFSSGNFSIISWTCENKGTMYNIMIVTLTLAEKLGLQIFLCTSTKHYGILMSVLLSVVMVMS